MMCGVLLITLPSINIGRNFTLVWEVMQRYKKQAMANNETTDDSAVDVSGRNHDDRALRAVILMNLTQDVQDTHL
ncbi:MAG: hypothetical protein J3Q66DRAFT_405606 [Benniella sp.]|nr:MAG: hypothetical protein J3Q66DRAFT_405606 [Benniella sp.]